MGNAVNPIQVGSKWKDKGDNVWEVVRLVPGGKVELFDRQRIWFSDTYQYEMRRKMSEGILTQVICV